MDSSFILEKEYFDLRAICNSGQVFRMYERRDGVFDIFSADRHLRVIEQAEANSYEFICSKEEFEEYWRGYFDLDRDYGIIVSGAIAGGDEFVSDACRKYSGIRILHQNIWEMMISFIISQQKQIPSIRKCIEGLCERFGEQKRGIVSWYAFPTPEAIAAGGPDGLKGLSLGYRERYIYETALQYISRGIPDEELESMSYADAKKYLLSFTGIGEKVANCILLFGAGFVDAFPIDTHIKDILWREYYCRECAENLPDRAEEGLAKESANKLTQADYERLADKYFGRYSPNRGIVQQWIFAAEIE